MIEFELPDDHPLIASLNKMLEWVRTSDVPDRVVGQPGDDSLSEEQLQKRMAIEIPNSCRMSRFDHHEGYDFDDVQKHAVALYEEKTGNKKYALIPVAKTWYPPGGGYIGWHIDQTGDRLYCAYAEGKSYFKYRDPETREVITSWDAPGKWSFRIFAFDEENPMWHAVYAEDLRVSVGYRFVLT